MARPGQKATPKGLREAVALLLVRIVAGEFA
jgi:hypothetical protein